MKAIANTIGPVALSERRAKSRLNALFRAIEGHILALADQAVVSAASFLTTIIISRFTDAGQLGTYAITVSILSSAYTIQGQLISLPYSIHRHRQFDEPAEHAGSSLVFAGLLSVAITLMLTIIAFGLFAGGAHAGLMAITWALAGVMPFALLRDFFRRFAFTHLQMAHALILDAAVAVLQLSLLIGLGWAGQMSATTACIALGTSCGIAAVGSFCFSHSRFVIRTGQVPTTMKQSWTLGKWLVVNQSLVQVQRYSAYWVSILIAGATVTGVYTACMSIVAFTNPLFYGLNNLLTQKSVLAWREGGGPRLRHQALHDLLLLAAALAPFCFIALWVGEDLMRLLYRGSEYQGYGSTIAVLAFATLASALGSPASNALASMERPRAILVINAMGTVLTVILVGFWTAKWGLEGAAYGWLLSNFIVSSGLWIGFLLLVPRPDGTELTLQILQKLTGSMDRRRCVITALGEGDHSNVYTAQSNDGQPIWRTYSTLVIKVYKPEANLTLEMVNEQFAALLRLHARLDGSVVNGWTISTPRPLFICESPLALVMTAIPAKKDLRSSIAVDYDLTHEILAELGRALVAAMQESWSRGEMHGDLGLQNVLYDIRTRQLSLIDPGTRECCIVCNDITNPWSPAVLELGHMLRDLGTDIRNLTGTPAAWLRRKIFTESALRAFLETIGSLEDRRWTLDEIRVCAQAHLSKVLEPRWSLRGLCRAPLTRFVVHRMDNILTELKVEIAARKEEPEAVHTLRPQMQRLAATRLVPYRAHEEDKAISSNIIV
jgi:O-antigen/teichoic acid export membrane protein